MTETFLLLKDISGTIRIIKIATVIPIKAGWKAKAK
jgi:hypothetical protein